MTPFMLSPLLREGGQGLAFEKMFDWLFPLDAEKFIVQVSAIDEVGKLVNTASLSLLRRLHAAKVAGIV